MLKWMKVQCRGLFFVAFTNKSSDKMCVSRNKEPTLSPKHTQLECGVLENTSFRWHNCLPVGVCSVLPFTSAYIGPRLQPKISSSGRLKLLFTQQSDAVLHNSHLPIATSGFLEGAIRAIIMPEYNAQQYCHGFLPNTKNPYLINFRLASHFLA